MSRSKGPRLYLDPRRQQWVIRDGTDFVRTGCARADLERAEKFLAEHIGRKHQPKPSPTPLIAEVLNVYAREHVPHLRTAKNISYNIGSLAKWWGSKRVTDINARSCRAYAATKTASAAATDLKVLKAALHYWHAEYGPLALVPEIWRPAAGAPRERWLTRSEAARLLWASRHVSYLARFILIGLYTGSRPGVIKTLRWDWIDFESGVMRRRAHGEREHATKRRPPVRLGRRILAHLKRWRRVDAGGVPWVVHYNGRQIDDPHTSWHRAVTAAELEGVTPHTLRHTRATWLMQAGVDPWQAAGALGMSVRVLEAVYGHQHPNWQKQASEV
jgi:integrase